MYFCGDIAMLTPYICYYLCLSEENKLYESLIRQFLCITIPLSKWFWFLGGSQKLRLVAVQLIVTLGGAGASEAGRAGAVDRWRCDGVPGARGSWEGLEEVHSAGAERSQTTMSNMKDLQHHCLYTLFITKSVLLLFKQDHILNDY